MPCVTGWHRRHTQRGDTALVILGRAGEDLEVHTAHQVIDIDQLQRDAQVRLVGTEALHGFGIRHGREVAQLDIQHFLVETTDHGLGHAHDVLLVDEAGLEVDLGEFRLTIGAQILVTEALGDLVVTIDTGDHQQLLEQLRRLRQREEAAGIGTARHQIVTCPFPAWHA